MAAFDTNILVRYLVEEQASQLEALALYQRSGADFSDCMHVALAHAAGQSPLWTFDKVAAKLSGARLLAAS